jgi:3-oxoacyl-[acyl-carrier protein] reductase
MRALVTGGSRGIGRATALALAERGARLTLLSRSSQALNEVLGLLPAGAVDEVLDAELSDPEAVRRLAQELGARDAFDVVIHAAGIIERGELVAMDFDSLRRQHEINFLAPLALTGAVLPRMLEAGQGRIVFVSSISASLPTATQIAYNSSKAALTMAMRCLALELRDTGLMTAAVLPGAVDTDMLKGSSFLPRMAPEEVAKTLTFLALDASLAHNGAVVEMFGT